MENVRALAQAYLQPVVLLFARLLVRLRISPNQVTVAGLLFAIFSASMVTLGFHMAAGIIFLFGSALDLLDGALARLEGRMTALGAFLDSTLDRVGEGAMFAVIAHHFALCGDASAVSAVVLAMLGGMLTSYTRARAETLGLSCRSGWASRPERVLIVSSGLMFDLLRVMVYLLAAVTLWTAAQRVFYVYKELRRRA